MSGTTKRKPAEPRSAAAKRLVQEVIVERGMGYEGAVRELEYRAAQASAPYHEAAAVIRDWLAR